MTTRRKVKYFTLEERIKIKELLDNKTSLKKIAIILDRHYSSINLEISKNGGIYNYDPIKAHENTGRKLNNFLKENEALILNLLNQGKSILGISRQLNAGYTTVLHFIKKLKQRVDKPYDLSNYTALEERIYALEQQIEIMFDTLKELKNDTSSFN